MGGVREDPLREVGDVGLNDEADVSGVESSGKLSTAQGFRKVRYSVIMLPRTPRDSSWTLDSIKLGTGSTILIDIFYVI